MKYDLNNSYQTREADFKSNTLNAEDRTVEITWGTSTPVLRSDSKGNPYYEVLSFAPGAVRMDRFEMGRVNLLDSHSRGNVGIGAILGVIEKGWTDPETQTGKGIARFSKRQEVEPIFQDVRDGIIKGASVGYRIHHTKEVTKKGDQIPTLLVTDFEPTEVSLVSVPADMRSGLRSTDPIQIEEIREMNVNQDEAPKKEGASHQKKERNTELSHNALNERARTQNIIKAVKAAKLSDELRDELISSGVPIDQARAKIIDELSKESSPVQTRSHIKMGDLNETDTRRNAMRDSILNRVDPGQYKIEGAAREYAGASLLDLSRECLIESGSKVRGLYPMDIAERALTTSDFQSILLGVANKTLRAAYQSAPQTFRPFCRVVQAANFKPLHSVQLGSDFKLEEVVEDGEIKRGKLTEGKEVYSVKTYAKIIPITRKVIINDDLNALGRLPAMAGVAAANLESNIVWGLITKPQIMDDGKPLFDKSHKNVGDAGKDLGLGAVSEGRVAIKQQRDLGDEFITIMPKYLVVPTSLETKALQFTSENMRATQMDQINPYANSLSVISEPRLDFSPYPNAWYLFASPDQIDMIEIAYLSGNNGVYIETKLGFEVDGIQMKIREDFGAHCIDYRGFYRNTGVKI